jgi:hypothetical protein
VSAISAQHAIHPTASWDCGRDKPNAVITAKTAHTPGQQKPVSIYNLNSRLRYVCICVLLLIVFKFRK